MARKITQNVNKDKLINDLPNVNPGHSKWLSRHTNYQASFCGDIVPIYCEEVLPNEYKKITLGMISHTQTPVAPIFPAMYTEIRAFFVPMRLAADLLNGYSTRKSPWVKVFGEDNSSSDASVIVPLANQKLPNVTSSFASQVSGWISSNLEGKRDNLLDSLDLVGYTDYQTPNYLNLASYELIYQRHYRNENYEASTASDLYKTLFNAYNDTSVTALPSTRLYERANREKDYFTGAKPFTQKGESVKLGFAENAQIIRTPVTGTSQKDFTFNGLVTKGDELKSPVTNASSSSSQYGKPEFAAGGNMELNISNFVANLKSASGISVEELRILVKTQELLEKDMLYGSMYAESLNSHFGCCPLDLTLQDPQELYRTTITSNMQAIFQTSSTSGEESILGTIGANSTTQTDPFVILPETKFVEHGILMICAVHKLQNVYDSNFFKPKFNVKKARFDFYTPELNDLGYQPITSDEMQASSSSVAGYNEAFAEYRFVFNKSHGSLNTEFPYWAPAIDDSYSSIAAMYKEGVGVLDKALSVTSSNSAQFFDAWGFEEECTKPMSLHSIPGFDGVI